jgi:hypothetical protein
VSQETAVPPGFWARVQQMIDTSIGKALRSVSPRGTSLSEGDFTITGGTLKVLAADGGNSFWLGSILPALPDGTYQPGFILRREDGSLAAALFDPAPAADGYHQFFALYDRGGNIIVSDDTTSGQGLARPFVGSSFYRTRFADFTAASTAAAFETLFTSIMSKQHPNLEVGYRASMDTTATTGEVRVMVNGVQHGATTTEGFGVASRYTGSLPVAGTHMSNLVVEIQARRTSATGVLRVEPLYCMGRQST